MSTGVKFVKINLSPADFLRALNVLETNHNTVSLIVSGAHPVVAASSATALSIWAEGTETNHEVTLNADGTWTATTVIEP